MGKYKQWLHHQEVGARLRDEIAAHEAERERVLKLAPPKETPLPDISNPVIAALLGQAALTKASEASAARAGRNGGSTTGVPTTGGIGQASATQAASGITGRPVPQASKPEAPTQEERVSAKPAPPMAAPIAASIADPMKPKPMATPAAPPKNIAEKPIIPPAPAEKPRAEAPAKADTIDPLLEQLLAQAENSPADPLEALNLLASQGPNLTRGEAPLPITTLPTAPLAEPASTGSSALNALLGESRGAPEPQKAASEPASGSVAVGVEAIATAELTARAEGAARVEKKRSDTDELVASRPTEGYTEPRLIVPQWLKSMEINQENEKAEDQSDEGDNKQRFSVSLPFENEEDMRLHESVERWWQRWRQQS
ncbi:MAG TPA: hypothetical protein VH599_17255 [Ktedonobacterales bacterium]|jgi:hypothetical protein